MAEKCSSAQLSQREDASQRGLGAQPTQTMIKEHEIASQKPEVWEYGLTAAPRQPPSPEARPPKSCLKLPAHSQTRPNRVSDKHIRFPPLGARCLITNTPYEAHLQDGKSWRRQQSEEKHEERTRQALSGSEEYRPYVKTDRWADRGWESTGLGEDTPMGGISEEMDLEVARWRARQIEFDQRLEEQQDLAEEHRFIMENEARRLHGAEDIMGTREFVRHRLKRIEIL